MSGKRLNSMDDLKQFCKDFLKSIQKMDTPELRKRYYEDNVIDTKGLDWYPTDPKKEDK